MEQQAEIVSHYYGAKYLHDKDCLLKLSFLERVMDDFLDQPLNKRLLPSAGYEAPARDPESMEW